MPKIWKIKQQIDDKEKNRQQAIVDILLSNRKLTTKQQQDEFFNPIDPKDLTLQDVNVKKTEFTKVIKRLKLALNPPAGGNKEKIIIYGDYDADGITSTAILWETLYGLGFNCLPFLPHREEQGYGLKPHGIDSVIEHHGKPDLIITVDNGIVAFEGADYCKKIGIDLIICDHHEAIPASNKFPENKHDKKIPDCIACIHSTQTSGSGLAFLLAKEIINSFPENKSDKLPTINSLVELATIGIIADLVPLLGVSRAIAKKGLELLPKTRRCGLISLFNQSGLDCSKPFSSYHIGFVIAPRLNATGRLYHPIDSLRLICAKDENKAMKLAINLGSINKSRQDITAENVDQVINKIKIEDKKEKIIITSSPDYNPGIIGLIAGKITEQFYRPSIAIAILGDIAKGSVRSISGINIIEFLRLFEDQFIELGGHEMAAGFSVETKNLDKLINLLEARAREIFLDENLIAKIEAETQLDIHDLTFSLHKKIQDFSPFGIGNPQPIFVTQNFTIKSFNFIGKKQEHLKLWLEKDNQDIEAIFFSASNFKDQIKIGQKVDCMYQLDVNEWNGKRKIQLVIKDIN